MKRFPLLLCLLMMLSACGSPYASDGSASDPAPDHSHVLVNETNVVEHDPVGYCGNTITTVRCERTAGQEENWERSFWGGISVSLSDFLRWLDYDDGICRCLPEYYVKTEFSSSEYGINLTEGYVRFEGKQVQLMQEQMDYLNQTLAAVAEGKVEGLCALPPAERAVYQLVHGPAFIYGIGSGGYVTGAVSRRELRNAEGDMPVCSRKTRLKVRLF